MREWELETPVPPPNVGFCDRDNNRERVSFYIKEEPEPRDATTNPSLRKAFNRIIIQWSEFSMRIMAWKAGSQLARRESVHEFAIRTAVGRAARQRNAYRTLPVNSEAQYLSSNDVASGNRGRSTLSPVDKKSVSESSWASIGTFSTSEISAIKRNTTFPNMGHIVATPESLSLS